jgi:hypothetical protein
LNFARAYYAYALGLPAECLSHLVKVPDLTDLQSHVPISTTIRSNGPALQVPVPGSGIDASSLSLGSSASESSVAIAEIKDGRAWAMTETFRSIYLLGDDPTKQNCIEANIFCHQEWLTNGSHLGNQRRR